MEDITEKRAVELQWDEVCSIISDEIKKILGFYIQCKVNVVEGSFWDVTFIDYRLPLPKLCQIIQTTHPTLEDWEDALPDEGGIDINGIGMLLAEKLIGRHLKITWEHHLIAVNSLWLVGVVKERMENDVNSRT